MNTGSHAFVFFFIIIFQNGISGLQISNMAYKDIVRVTYESCIVAIPEALGNEQGLHQLSSVVDLTFKNERGVLFYQIDFSKFASDKPSMSSFVDKGMHSINYTNSFLIFKHVKRDRTCLLTPPVSEAPKPEIYSFEIERDYNLNNVVKFINDHCHTFREANGNLTPQGIHRDFILDNLFSITQAIYNNGVLREKSYDKESKYTIDDDRVCRIDSKSNDCSKQSNHNNSDSDSNVSSSSKSKKQHAESSSHQEMRYCERIELPTSSEFIHEYLTLSKPVVISGATKNWPVFKKWTNKFLLDQYGNTKVHIKITPNGEYEGVESRDLWEKKSKIKIPNDVLEQLLFPDLVVVRPATMELKFSEFIHLIENISSSKSSNISAYLEYSSISYFPNLEEDIDEMSFIKGILRLKHTNVWLSDGNTVGKLHFDPFDNFMCQISGEKEFVIYEPHANERLYEAHIQEAVLSYNTSSKSFSRRNLLESTSMVMSPVDIEKPDLQKFPRFAEVKPMSCTIKPGDVLFTPAFWWHEVRSKPNTTEGRNLAVNFWYEPFFLKEFPCPECRLNVNPEYFHLL